MRIVCQTVRRITNEILGDKRLGNIPLLVFLINYASFVLRESFPITIFYNSILKKLIQLKGDSNSLERQK